MADRRRGKQKRQQELTENPSKVEKAVAKHLRFNVTSKEGKLVGMPVQYFIANDAVNCLLDSKWAKKDNKNEVLFTNRASCVDYCHRLLMHGMFHRAVRAERKPRDKADKKKKREVEEGNKEEEKKSKKEKRSKRKEKEEADKKEADKKEESEGEKGEKEKEEKKESDEKDDKKEEERKKKRKEKKIKLEMVDNQVFKDGDEIYVWIYDPVPLKTFVIGLFLVLGAIGVCLFPLWPPEVRLGVYYISLTVAGAIGCLLALCVVRVILFGMIWGITFGRHHFWFLPNLNEDVGFVESFQPVYLYEYHGGNSDEDKEKDKNKEGTDSDKEKDGKKDAETEAEKDSPESKETKEGSSSRDCEGDKGDTGEDTATGTEESENDNGYEIVDADDLANGDNICEGDESKKDV